MTRPSTLAVAVATTVIALAAAVDARALGPLDPARQPAPADGWAGEAGGTRGGADAASEHVSTVSTRAELLAALAKGGTQPKIVKVNGIIDMSEGRPFANSADQGRRGAIHVPSNTTLIGNGPGAGFVNASVMVQNASQVIIRNLAIRNPCDVGPLWDPKDGPTGNWNSLFDGVVISASDHVWVDHNSFTDAPQTDDKAPVENGMLKQCHDGALDITKGSDYVTVSYNHFAEHEKNSLFGSSDKATGDEGHLRITVAHNLFEHVHERAPRVRFGQVHVFNNYYAGERQRPVYSHGYSIGVGKEAKIISQNNVFDIVGASACVDVVRTPASTSPTGRFTDSGSLLNGQPLTACPFDSAVGWKVPYAFTPLPAAAVKADVLAHAGAGQLAAGAVTLAPQLKPATADYYVEARIKPQAQAGQVYLVARYVDPRNWYAAGLDVAGGKGKLRLEIMKMQDGVLTRLKQVSRNAPVADRFHTLRYELIGPDMVLYLNGERVTFAADRAFTQPGAIGVYQTDDAAAVTLLRSGDANSKPARIALALAGNSLNLQAGDAPRKMPVSALLGDGKPFAFRATSSDARVARVSVQGQDLVVTPSAPGSASITLSSAADPAVETVVTLQVAPPFKAPTRSDHLGKAVLPAPGASKVQADTLPTLTFDQAPTLGASGSVRIYRQADNALVDILPVGDDYDVLGFAGQAVRRAVRYQPIHIAGNQAVIKPHTARLAPNTGYYVEVGQGTLVGQLNGKPFEGIGKAARWRFRTGSAVPARATLTVDDDGPADFRTVQGALNAAMQAPKDQPVTIDVRNGHYNELLYLRDKNNVTVHGESRDGVVIHATNNETLNPGSGAGQVAGSPSANGGRALLLVEAADLLTLDNLTLRNTTLRSAAQSGQAETLHFNDDAGRLVARHASFFSEQDTLNLKGYAWFYRTLVAGNVDFIWGSTRAALFEESEIRSVGDSANASSGGYVLQARVANASDKGFVFLNSALTHGPGPGAQHSDVPPGATYLARSPGGTSSWDNIAFINCKMDSHVAPAGWAGLGVNGQPAPNPTVATAASGWREFGSTDLQGSPLNLGARVGGYVLSAEEAAAFSDRAKVFAAYPGGWNPQP
ncbi:MAG: pectinesterase family protein [Gammaproteobacteria bacterium]